MGWGKASDDRGRGECLLRIEAGGFFREIRRIASALEAVVFKTFVCV